MTGARYADILQNSVIELSEQINVDIVRMKCVGILSEANRFQPLAHAAHIASCSSSALASFRSSVSKPSVNHS